MSKARPKTTKRVLVRVANDIVATLINGIPPGYVNNNPLPKDAVLINAQFAFPDVLELIFEHESFNEIDIHEAPPIWNMTFSQTEDNSNAI